MGTGLTLCCIQLLFKKNVTSMKQLSSFAIDNDKFYVYKAEKYGDALCMYDRYMLLYFSNLLWLIKTTCIKTLASFVVAYFLPGVNRKRAGFSPAFLVRCVITTVVLAGTPA